MTCIPRRRRIPGFVQKDVNTSEEVRLYEKNKVIRQAAEWLH